MHRDVGLLSATTIVKFCVSLVCQSATSHNYFASSAMLHAPVGYTKYIWVARDCAAREITQVLVLLPPSHSSPLRRAHRRTFSVGSHCILCTQENRNHFDPSNDTSMRSTGYCSHLRQVRMVDPLYRASTEVYK